MYKKLKILHHFLETPEREFHIREIAKKTRMSPMSARKYLLELRKEGMILELPAKLRAKNYRANLDNPLLREEKRHHMIRKIIESGLLATLDKELGLPTVFLFGSTAKGEDTSASDIDLLVLSATKKRIPLEKYEESLGRHIQIFLIDDTEFEALKATNKHLVNNIINGIRLSGFLEAIR